MNTEIDMRHTPRIPTFWPAILMPAHEPIKAMTKDISMCGVLILCRESVETDDEFEMVLKFYNNLEMQFTAKRVWSNKVFSGKYYYYEFGNLFTKISSSDREIIASLVSEYYLI